MIRPYKQKVRGQKSLIRPQTVNIAGQKCCARPLMKKVGGQKSRIMHYLLIVGEQKYCAKGHKTNITPRNSAHRQYMLNLSAYPSGLLPF